MYKYRIKEQGDETLNQFHDQRIMAFDSLEARLEDIKKLLRQGKIETIAYYRENPTSYTVVKGTDLINDYINDIEILLKGEE
jgi:hypothetical protein